MRLLVFALFLVLALRTLASRLLPLIAGLGIAGAAVALALQGVLGNVAAGSRSSSRGRSASANTSRSRARKAGTDISLFSDLRHSDLSRVVIPNRKIAGEIPHNWRDPSAQPARVARVRRRPERRARRDRGRVRENARVLQDPAHSVQTALLGELSITISVMPWVAVREYGAASAEINAAILREFRRRGLSLQAPVSLPDHARSTRHA